MRKQKRLSASSPELLFSMRLQTLQVRIAENREKGTRLVSAFSSGSSVDQADLTGFIQEVRPVITLERQLAQFLTRWHISKQTPPQPQGDGTTMQSKLEMVMFHLADTAAAIQAVLAYLLAAPADSLPQDFVDAMDELLTNTESLYGM